MLYMKIEIMPNFGVFQPIVLWAPLPSSLSSSNIQTYIEQNNIEML